MKRISSFSVILIMVVLMIIGTAMIPLLNIQYSPVEKKKSLTVSYRWYGASARVVEKEITTILEGIFAPISGIREINSVSYKGGGNITLYFKAKANLDVIRFEVASKIKQIYHKLPEGASYPSLSTSTSGEYTPAILTYTINADLPTLSISQYAEKSIRDPLSRIDGIKEVSVSGATPFEWVISFDPNLCSTLQITGSEIEQAIRAQNSNDQLGMGTTEQGAQMRVNIKSNELSPQQWEQIEIKNSNGRIITLADIATIEHRESLPQSYYRLNGLNNINLSITPEKHTNTLVLTKRVKSEIAKIRANLPSGYSLTLVNDTSEYITQELNKIYLRCGLSVLILLVFVYLVSRNFRYLLLIFVTMLANILISFIFFNIFELEIHLYSLAGITVALGLVIDTTIIMTDYYSRYRDLKIYLAILAALLTSIGALLIVFLLPEKMQANLVDFVLVIIINLSVSLVISLFFVPAILDKYPIRRNSKRRKKSKRRRRIIKISRQYGRFISWGKRHKWVFILCFVLAFGIPLQLLPPKIGLQKSGRELDTLNFGQKLYNHTIGSELYQKRLKDWVEPALGGTMRMFNKKAMGENSFRDEPERTALYINAALPEGCTIDQLNETVKEMELFLSQYSEIESFQTSIYSYSNASIVINFKPEAEKNGFAYRLKELSTSKAISLGGATWSVYGVGQGFSNDIGGSGYKSNQIQLTGYNYEQLYRIAQGISDTISKNQRVKDIEISGAVSWGSSKIATEFYLDFNFEAFALYKVRPTDYYKAIEQQLYRTDILSVYNDGQMEKVVLESRGQASFDRWHLENDIINVASQNVKLSELGSISKRSSGNNIYKNNQQYKLIVAFNFVGSWELANRYINKQIERISAGLPLGYKVKGNDNYYWGQGSEKTQYNLILLVIAIIFFICAILFESLIQPLVIICMIPISFIGVFLTFWLFGLQFDQGGFASFILLCGLVINAGIYILNEYNRVPGSGIQRYIRAFNRKITPIMLTIISTVVGLTPFIIISREPFWFTFASGVIGGMVFSIVAITIFLPIFTRITK